MWQERPRPLLTVAPKKFQLAFNFHEFVSTHKKSGYFINLFQRTGRNKNDTI